MFIRLEIVQHDHNSNFANCLFDAMSVFMLDVILGVILLSYTNSISLTVNPRFSPRGLLSILKFHMGAYSRGGLFEGMGLVIKRFIL